MQTAPPDLQPHQTSDPEGFVAPRVLPLVYYHSNPAVRLFQSQNIPPSLLVPTPAPGGTGPNNTGKRHISSQGGSFGSTAGIPTAPSAPHPPSKVSPLLPALPSPKISHLGAGAFFQQALWAWGAAAGVPQMSCQVLGDTWRGLLGWHVLTSPLLCSSQIPLYQPPWTSRFLGERGQEGQLAAAAPQELGAAGASPPRAQGKQLHLGRVRAARHQPGLEAAGDTEDRQLLLVLPPDPPEAPTAPQGRPGAGTGTSMGTRAVPCPPTADPEVTSTAWVWGFG